MGGAGEKNHIDISESIKSLFLIYTGSDGKLVCHSFMGKSTQSTVKVLQKIESEDWMCKKNGGLVYNMSV